MASPPFCIVLISLLLSSVCALTPTKCCKSIDKISVTGIGNIEYKANIAVVRLGVSLSGKTPGSVQSRLAKRSARLVRFLRLNSVQKLQTTGVTLTTQRNHSTTPPKIVGYSGSNTVSFEVIATSAGRILDGAVRNGATDIESVSFKGSPAVVFAARRKALQQATSRAQQEARTVVLALGKTLGGPVNVRVDSFQSAPPTESRSFKRSSAFRVSTAVVAGRRSGRASVSIDFKIF